MSTKNFVSYGDAETVLSDFADSIKGKEPLIFKGTKAQWDALTAEEKAVYSLVGFPDIAEGGAIIVDEVTEGNLNAVTSNAVYGAIGNWVQKSGTTATVGYATDVTVNITPSSGKVIKAVGAIGIYPSDTWGTYPIIMSTTTGRFTFRTLAEDGITGTSQTYKWNCWVLEVDE